jgi:hypothetical protein
MTALVSMAKLRQIGSALATATAAVVILASGVSGAWYDIDTDDGTVGEWDTQGIVMFQPDPVGDALQPDGTPGGRADDDIVAIWVASGTGQTGLDSLFFRAQLNGSPALDENLRAIAAAIDCDRNGSDTERQDRVISYFVTSAPPPFPPPSDLVRVYTGDQAYGYDIGESITPRYAGQRVQDYIEWSVPIQELPITGQDPPGTVVDCKNLVNIRFTTFEYPKFGGLITKFLDTTESLGWNIAEGKPIPADLAISRPADTDDALLVWNLTAQSEDYAVMRAVAPYDLANYSPHATVDDPTYTEMGVLGDGVADAFFYLVRGRTDEVATVDPSNEVGLFEFALVPGAS